MTIKVIQTSPPQTGSTLLLNLIQGFLKPEDTYHGEDEIDKTLIVKSHQLDISKFKKNMIVILL